MFTCSINIRNKSMQGFLCASDHVNNLLTTLISFSGNCEFQFRVTLHFI
eukprot:UN00096